MSIDDARERARQAEEARKALLAYLHPTLLEFFGKIAHGVEVSLAESDLAQAGYRVVSSRYPEQWDQWQCVVWHGARRVASVEGTLKGDEVELTGVGFAPGKNTVAVAVAALEDAIVKHHAAFQREKAERDAEARRAAEAELASSNRWSLGCLAFLVAIPVIWWVIDRTVGW